MKGRRGEQTVEGKKREKRQRKSEEKSNGFHERNRALNMPEKNEIFEENILNEVIWINPDFSLSLPSFFFFLSLSVSSQTRSRTHLPSREITESARSITEFIFRNLQSKWRSKIAPHLPNRESRRRVLCYRYKNLIIIPGIILVITVLLIRTWMKGKELKNSFSSRKKEIFPHSYFSVSVFSLVSRRFIVITRKILLFKKKERQISFRFCKQSMHCSSIVIFFSDVEFFYDQLKCFCSIFRREPKAEIRCPMAATPSRFPWKVRRVWGTRKISALFFWVSTFFFCFWNLSPFSSFCFFQFLSFFFPFSSVVRQWMTWTTARISYSFLCFFSSSHSFLLFLFVFQRFSSNFSPFFPLLLLFFFLFSLL